MLKTLSKEIVRILQDLGTNKQVKLCLFLLFNIPNDKQS